LAYAADQEITVVVDIAPYALLARQPLDITFCDDTKSAFLPSIDRDHEMARKAFDDVTRHQVGEAFILQRGDERIQSGLGAGHRNGPDHAGKDEPWRRVDFARVFRPSEPATADKPAVNKKRIRPIDRD